MGERGLSTEHTASYMLIIYAFLWFEYSKHLFGCFWIKVI